LRDVDLAEELAALERWPQSGVPRKPGAWLMTAAKRRAIRRGLGGVAARSEAR
jgi:predicted RNA polymerase sigma factor